LEKIAKILLAKHQPTTELWNAVCLASAMNEFFFNIMIEIAERNHGL
jgi:hypothetical protein